MTTPSPNPDAPTPSTPSTPSASPAGHEGQNIPVQPRFFVQFIDDQSDDWNEGSTWAPTEEMGRKLLEVFKHTIENDPNMQDRLTNAKYRLVRRYVTNPEIVDEVS